MAAIEVLPDDLINQIAAGEVVERPASVVKELVENSLDAGASKIDVAIAGGGIRWIAVTDDGVGLSPHDAARAFLRHATSKIRSQADLAGVTTLGFRGEALPSIASVARVRLRSRTSDASVGTEITVEGGGIKTQSDIGCPEGTRLEVAELFAKVPARRKFLKTDVTESSHIVRALERVALTRPDVRFSLERDGRASLLFPATRDPRERAIAVLPSSLGERLVPVSGEIESAALHGYTTPTDVFRASTTDIHVLVNGRPVRDRFLLYAVRSAYEDALPAGRHPAAVLYLQIDPSEVDVNVHPAKSEVRFRDPGAIRALVRDSLRQALGRPARRAGREVSYAPGAGEHSRVADASPPADLKLFGGAAPLEAVVTGYALGADQPPAARFVDYDYLGQVLGTYLVLEGSDTLLLLDQHAAHERVLFEKLRQTLLSKPLDSQRLLIPQWIELPTSAAEALEKQAGSLARAGFDLEFAERGVRGGMRVGVRAVPAPLLASREPDWRELLEETAACLQDPEAAESRGGLAGALHHIAATAACHAAVRKGDRLEPKAVDALLAELDATVWFPNCPHGRPILVELTEGELERRFARR